MGLNILLTRIDNRLIHGQVGITWTKDIGANLIVVADDEVADDEVQQELMRFTAENSGADVRFFTVRKTIEVIHRASDRQKIFIVCRNPESIVKLVDGNVPIDKLNIGNMHSSPGKRQLTKKVFVDDRDIDNLKYLHGKGMEIFIQDVPDDVRIRFEDIID